MVELWGKTFERKELLRRVGGLAQVAGVRLVTLGDGSERGSRVLEFRTGSGWTFEVLVDRGFDLGHAEYAGRPLSWHSGVGFPGPWYYEPTPMGFLRSFGGGLLTTGGLDHTLFATEDTARQYQYPPKPTEQYGLHGRISNRPARLLGYGERWEVDGCLLWAEGEVLQVSALGEYLALHRRIETRVGACSLTIHDEVKNIGYHPTPHMYLYHINIGFPLVDHGTEILLPAARYCPCGTYPDANYTPLTEPQVDFEEQVFEYEPVTEPGGAVPVALLNQEQGLGMYAVYQAEQFPHPFLWRMLGEGAYVVALEPSTNRVAGRHDARARGELLELAAGESRNYDVELGVLVGEQHLSEMRKRITALCSG